MFESDERISNFKLFNVWNFVLLLLLIMVAVLQRKDAKQRSHVFAIHVPSKVFVAQAHMPFVGHKLCSTQVNAPAAAAHSVSWVFQVAHEAAASERDGLSVLNRQCLRMMETGVAAIREHSRVSLALPQVVWSDIGAKAWSAKCSPVFVWLSESACVLVATYRPLPPR